MKTDRNRQTVDACVAHRSLRYHASSVIEALVTTKFIDSICALHFYCTQRCGFGLVSHCLCRCDCSIRRVEEQYDTNHHCCYHYRTFH